MQVVGCHSHMTVFQQHLFEPAIRVRFPSPCYVSVLRGSGEALSADPIEQILLLMSNVPCGDKGNLIIFGAYMSRDSRLEPNDCRRARLMLFFLELVASSSMALYTLGGQNCFRNGRNGFPFIGERAVRLS